MVSYSEAHSLPSVAHSLPLCGPQPATVFWARWLPHSLGYNEVTVCDVVELYGARENSVPWP